MPRIGGLTLSTLLLPTMLLVGTPSLYQVTAQPRQASRMHSESPTARPPARLTALTALPPDSQPLFESNDVLHVTLEMDIHTVTRDIGEDREEHPATLSYTDEDGELVVLEATVRTRGKFRRDWRNCDFPPLKIDLKKHRFPDDQLAGTLFENQNELKLVCHCRNDVEEYQQFVLKEYVAYRIYQMLTDLSYSVRLASVTYADVDGRRPPFTRYAFFIEDEEKMAARNGAVVLDSLGVRQMDLDDQYSTLFSFFQYFIGNCDWKVSALHNVTLLRQGVRYPIAVPYDFDWAGVVDPPYAVPPAALGTGDVRERVFISPCRTAYDIERTIEILQERKEAIYALYSDLSALDEHARSRCLEYLEEFYDLIGDPDEVRRTFHRSCGNDLN